MTVSEEQHPGPEGHQPPEQLAGETKLVLPWSPPETGLTPASGRDAMGRLTGLEVVPPGQGPRSSTAFAVLEGTREVCIALSRHVMPAAYTGL